MSPILFEDPEHQLAITEYFSDHLIIFSLQQDKRNTRDSLPPWLDEIRVITGFHPIPPVRVIFHKGSPGDLSTRRVADRNGTCSILLVCLGVM